MSWFFPILKPITALDLEFFILKTAFYEADENIRQRNIVRVNNRRNYLQKKLNNITHEDQRKVIFSLLEKNEYKAMLLDSEGPFVAEVLQKPFVSVYRSEPKMIMLIMPIGVCILIYILTMTIILVFHSLLQLFFLFIQSRPNPSFTLLPDLKFWLLPFIYSHYCFSKFI